MPKNTKLPKAKDGHWIEHAHLKKGLCTPMTKSTCTPRRKALAETFKKHHGFQKGGGGVVDKLQGNPEYNAMSLVLMNRNKDLNFVDRMTNAQDYPRLKTKTIPGFEKASRKDYSTHLMAWNNGNDVNEGNPIVYPEITQDTSTGKLNYRAGVDAQDYAEQTGQYIPLPPSDKFAEYFSSIGYKYPTGVRVDQKAQGGKVSRKIPTYNQAGYEGFSEYNPVWNEIYLAPKDKDQEVVKRHELWHANQRNSGKLRVGDSVPTIPPSLLSPDSFDSETGRTSNAAYDYYNRNTVDANYIKDHQAEIHQNLTGNIWTPDMNLMSDDLRDGLAHEASYSLPWTAEGEAEKAAQLKYINPYKMQFKKNGGKVGWRILPEAGDGMILNPPQPYTAAAESSRVPMPMAIDPTQEAESFRLQRLGNQVARSRPASGQTEYVPIESLMLPVTPAIGGVGKLANLAVDYMNPVSGFGNPYAGVEKMTSHLLERSAENVHRAVVGTERSGITSEKFGGGVRGWKILD